MLRKALTLILVLSFSSTVILSQERIFWNVENTGAINHIENTLMPTYLPNSKCVYWQFSSKWSFANFTDKTVIRLDGEYTGLANCWSYGYYNGNSNIHFNLVSSESFLHPFYIMDAVVNNPYENTDIKFRTDKYLPEEQDWKTCKEFLTQLIATNPDFHIAHWHVFWGVAEYDIVAVTLGYSANEFAGKDTNTLYWSAALIDTVEGNIYYCYADAYDVENIYCYHTSIKEPTTITNLQVSPNPTSNSAVLTLDLETAGELTVTLNDLLGQKLFELHNAFENTGRFTKTFSIETLPIGVYYLKISHNGNVKIEKVIKN